MANVSIIVCLFWTVQWQHVRQHFVLSHVSILLHLFQGLKFRLAKSRPMCCKLIYTRAYIMSQAKYATSSTDTYTVFEARILTWNGCFCFLFYVSITHSTAVVFWPCPAHCTGPAVERRVLAWHKTPVRPVGRSVCLSVCIALLCTEL